MNIYVPGSKPPMLGKVIPDLIGNPYNGYITPTVGLMSSSLMETMGVLDPTYCNMNILEATNISFSQGTFEILLLFARLGYVTFPEG